MLFFNCRIKVDGGSEYPIELTMEIQSTNPQNGFLADQKKGLARSLMAGIDGFDRDSPPCNHQINCCYHGIDLAFHSSNKNFIESLENFLPKSWFSSSQSETPRINIYCYHPPKNMHWIDEAAPDCFIEKIDGTEVAIQRDFLGIDHSDPKNSKTTGKVSAIFPLEIGDGLFNMLRWLIPRKMILNNLILLHSSCVIGKDGKAYLFLGHSGAGKSTIAKLAGPKRTVLGDDMNIIKIQGNKKDNRFVVESAILGQMIFSQSEFDIEHTVGGCFWINKDKENSITPIKRSHSALKFLASIPNMFWENSSSPLHSQKTMEMATKLSSAFELKQLNFKRDNTFWSLIDEI